MDGSIFFRNALQIVAGQAYTPAPQHFLRRENLYFHLEKQAIETKCSRGSAFNFEYSLKIVIFARFAC